MQIVEGGHPYSVDGDGVGVVLSHGFTGMPASMMPLARVCEAQGWSVRLPRLPGHGTTWQDLNTTTWPMWAEEIERATAELLERCRTVVVVGLSMGGTLATLMAERHPELAGLFLINPAFVMKDKRLLAVPALSRVVPSIPAISGDIKKPGVPEPAYERTPLRALASQMKMWKLVTQDLPGIEMPVTICRSSEDHVVPPECGELFIERVGSTDVRDVVLRNSYHVATLDHDAELIERTLVDFVRELDARRAPARP